MTGFPQGFIWGTATSSYQIEGAWNEGGKGESIWDRFSHTPGRIDNGDTGDIACDHYHRWREDIELMSWLGLDAYRFSISWPRVLPEGRGRINLAGVDFYSRLVDGLLEAGIEPFLTLYHWDLPQALQAWGGWPARDTAKAFVEYADHVSRRLGDRVKYWMTLNEPYVSAVLGYLKGRHAPGHADLGESLSAAHHLLLAHGWAVPVIRSNSSGTNVGIVLNMSPQVPASPSEADQEAARMEDGKLNRWYLDPLVGRGYPPDVIEHYEQPMDFCHTDDLKAMMEPLDFWGLNYYSRQVVRSEVVPEHRNEPREVFVDSELTEMGWEVYPNGLYQLLQRLHTEYQLPAIYLTENGAAYPDQVGSDGEIVDSQRIAYMRAHLEAAHQAIAAGVPLRGYFYWSLLDNFEWSYGFSKRFGLIYVDYQDLQRIPKASAYWYRRVTEANALVEG